ncbi:hypothetical protein [Aeromicrobium sp. NPDC092404]|uniref:hypothetical protein n=1 Tax=Aeromicrobium sp. NPDC092404 TaxID=3154976 RepID=UPI00343DE34E
MGLFGKDKRSDAERTEDAMQQAERIVGGKGLTGKLAKGFMGADTMAKFGDGLATARNAQADAAIAASGIPGVKATVTGLADTGTMINNDPVVNLSVTLESGQALQMDQILVSKLQIPRVGDSVNLIPNPSAPGTYVYGGLAV